MTRPLTIGQVARAAGVNVETVRYYQRVGLVTEPPKPASGFRIYSSETIDRINFIKRAQQLGFNLKEITELLDLGEGRYLGEGRCADVRTRAEEKRAHIDSQIADLQRLRETLDSLIRACSTEHGAAQCPIVETLSGSDA